MGRPSALLIMGRDGLPQPPRALRAARRPVRRPGWLQRHRHDDLPGQTEESALPLRPAGAVGHPPAAPARAGRGPLPDGAQGDAPARDPRRTYTVRVIEGGPEAIGSAYIKRFPHLPYQEITVNILDGAHPVTAGVEDFVTSDELYCLEALGPRVEVLASYDGRAAGAALPDRGGASAESAARRGARLAPDAAPGAAGLRHPPGRGEGLRQRPGARPQRHRQPRLPPADHPGGALAHRRRPRLMSPGLKLSWSPLGPPGPPGREQGASGKRRAIAAGGKVPADPIVAETTARLREPGLTEDERTKTLALRLLAPGSDPTALLPIQESWPEAQASQAAAGRATRLEEWWSGGRAPMLVIQGLQDKVAPPGNGRDLKTNYADRVTLVEIDGAGHGIVVEYPARIAEEAARFLSEHPIRAGAAR